MSTILIGSNDVDYHADRTRLSSSNLKMLLKDPEKFYIERILNQKPEEEERSYFSEGKFLHSLVLEPDKVSQYAIFPGLRKSGKVWEDFKAENKGKTILSAPQVNRCEVLYKNYSLTKVAVELIQGGFAEHTMLGEILDVPVKVRADYINVDKGYIVDLKTSSSSTDIELFRHTIAEYRYDLSAAMYCQVALETYKKLFDYYFIVVSKEDGGVAVYKASSDTLSKGAGLMLQAIVKYKKGMETGKWIEQSPIILSEEILEV